MLKRGRKSAASLEVATISAVDTPPRQRPPHELTDEETEVWAAVVSSEAADWFTPATVPLLAQYCRHVVQAKRVAELIERATGDPQLDFRDYDKLLAMQERESRAIASLATKLRVAQQSTTNHRGNRKPSQARKPWESN